MRKIIVCYILVSTFFISGCQKEMTEKEKTKTKSLFELAMEANNQKGETSFIFFIDKNGKVITASLPLSSYIDGESVKTMRRCCGMYFCTKGFDMPVIHLRYVDQIILDPLSEEGVKAWKVFARQ